MYGLPYDGQKQLYDIRCEGSMQDIHSEDMANFLVMRILFPDPIGMFVSDLHPKPISKIRMELPIRVEAVAPLNHTLRVSPLQNFSRQDLHRREVIIYCIEVFECFLSKDFRIDLRQIFSTFISEIANGLIAIEPSPAWTNFETVKEIVNCAVRDIERVSISVKVVIQQSTITQSQNDHVTTCRNHRVDCFQIADYIFSEVLWLAFALETLGADIIADELEEHDERVILLRISLEGGNVVSTVVGISTIDCDVLEIVVVAKVPVPQILVD